MGFYSIYHPKVGISKDFPFDHGTILKDEEVLHPSRPKI